MSKIIIANFKMNGTKSSIQEWFNVFSEENNTSNKIIVALPSPFLADFATNDINVASQNVSSHDSGAFTSQVSAGMLRDCNINYSIICDEVVYDCNILRDLILQRLKECEAKLITKTKVESINLLNKKYTLILKKVYKQATK